MRVERYLLVDAEAIWIVDIALKCVSRALGLAEGCKSVSYDRNAYLRSLIEFSD